jgi:hypothetical protein
MNRTSRFTSLPCTRGPAEGNNARFMRKLIVGLATTVLLWGGVAVAGLGLTAGTAQADDWYGPHRWCPGQSMNHPAGPGTDAIWDMSVCHTWYAVGYAQGNVPLTSGTPSDIWDGDNPPPKNPPPGPLPLWVP